MLIKEIRSGCGPGVGGCAGHRGPRGESLRKVIAEYRDICLGAGMDGHLTKPIEQNKLRELDCKVACDLRYGASPRGAGEKTAAHRMIAATALPCDAPLPTHSQAG